MPDRRSFGRLATRIAWLPGLLIVPSMVFAAIVEYTVTFDTMIRNGTGSWGGNIPVEAAREANVSLIYRYVRVESGRFELYSVQMLDNTRSLASDRFFGTGELGISYDFDGVNDRYTRAATSGPGGWIVTEVEGEFGSVGDPLPSGPEYDALVNAEVLTTVAALPPDDTYAIFHQQLQPGTFEFSSRALPDPALDLLQCPGDVNNDGRPDVVVVALDGNATARSLDGTLINELSLDVGEELVDVELMSDTNGNGAAEIVALRRGSSEAEVRDLLTSAALSTVGFDSRVALVDLEVMADRDSNGIPELAFLGFDPNQRALRVGVAVEVKDALTGERISRVDSLRWSVPKDLDLHGDSDGNGEPEVAVLGDNVYGRRFADSLRISDTASGGVVREIWLGAGWNVLWQQQIGDVNGNGSEEIAVLRVQPPRRVNIQIRDSLTRERVRSIGFARKYPPEHVISIPDIDGNGVSELVVFGLRFDGRNQKAVIKDSRTGAKLRDVWFDRGFPGYAFADCGDIDGNGAHDLALLGERQSDRRRKVTIKDSRNGTSVAQVWF